MAQLLDILLIIHFLVIIAIVFSNLYNILNVGKIFGFDVSVMLFTGMLIAWLLGLITFLMDVENTTYRMIFIIDNFFLMLNLVFFIIEIMFLFMGKDKTRTNYNPREEA